MKRSEENPGDGPSKMAIAMSVGVILVTNVVGGTALGYWVDQLSGTQPWGLVSGVILGTISAFVGVYRIVQRLN